MSGAAPGGRPLAVAGAVRVAAGGTLLAGRAGRRERVAAQLGRHDRDGELLARLLHHPHHQRDADQDLEVQYCMSAYY